MADQYLSPTPYANQFTGYSNDLIQGLLGYMKDKQRTQQMQGLAGLLESTGIPQSVERAAYAQSPKALLDALTNVNRANVPLLKSETADALMTVAPMVGPAARMAERGAMAAGRAGERLAERVVPQVMESGGLPAQLLEDLAQGSRSQIFRPINSGDEIGGLTVRSEIPNTSSISSELNNYETLGLQEVPMSAFQNKSKPKYYSKQEEERTKKLAEQINTNKEINPLIVVKDNEGYYVLEGGHRFDALKELDAKSFPALVVQDTESMPIGGLLGQAKAAEATDLLSYRGSHTAPNPEFGAPLHDLTGGGQMYPADVYSSKAAQYYGTGYAKADKEAFALANKVRGNPDAEVTMYRAVPKDAGIGSINKGDWVTLSKDYAKNHGESVLDNNYKIISQKVKAKDLWTNADSIQEFGYWPE